MERALKKQLENLYEQEAKNVYKYIFHLCGDRELAQDITAETFIRAVDALPKFKGQCKELTWLCQIAKHLLYAEWKKKKKSEALQMALQDTEEEQKVEEAVFRSMEKLDWFQKLQGLDAVTREVIYLRIYGELSFREIGEVLGKTENWARVTFYRGKQKLKGVYGNERT